MNSSLLLVTLLSFVLPVHKVLSHDAMLFTRVLEEHVANGRVDYPAIAKDKRFDTYLKQIQHTNLESFATRNDSLAFWINVYNAFTIKLITDHLPVKSIRDITSGGKSPWDIRWIRIQDSIYSLNDIEHGIIRKSFDEPLIHMALVCAAISCPPLRSEAYVGATLNDQLQNNTARFFADTSKNRYDPKSNILYLSEIFQWYGTDFDARYGSAAQFALDELGLAGVKPRKVMYIPYDWSLNQQ